MIPHPTPLQTLKAVIRGFLPRVLQPRGWVLAALACLPVALALLITTIVRLQDGGSPAMLSKIGLKVYHEAMIKFMLPIMALVAAPAGIREDLEQRTLPLMLARPAQAWVLPFGKGVVWFFWGALWLLVAALGLLGLGVDPMEFPRQASALVFTFWAQLGFLSLLGLVFKRGTLWGALYLFVWEGFVRILPGAMQRLTFVHYVESITGSRGGEVGAKELLAQTQITSPLWLSLLVLTAVGAAGWALCGWKLETTPVGLAGAEAEG
jgi:ABC-type transport system involved in multi-copper enzyme maturation permease subunit